MTDTTTTTLTVEQQQRAEAIRLARSALAGMNRAPKAEDVLHLASWIVSGNDPWVDIIADAAEKAAEPIAETIKTIIGNERVQCTSAHYKAATRTTHRCLLTKGHAGMHHDPTDEPEVKWCDAEAVDR